MKFAKADVKVMKHLSVSGVRTKRVLIPIYSYPHVKNEFVCRITRSPDNSLESS